MFATPEDTHKLFIVQKLQVQILGAKVLLNTLQTVLWDDSSEMSMLCRIAIDLPDSMYCDTEYIQSNPSTTCIYAADMQLWHHSELSGLMKEQMLFWKEVSFVVWLKYVIQLANAKTHSLTSL